MSNSTATEAEWQANYQITDQGAHDSRRPGSGRHRSSSNHHRSPMHQQGQPGGSHASSHMQSHQSQQHQHQQQQQHYRQAPQQQHQQRTSKHQQVTVPPPRQHAASGVTGEYRGSSQVRSAQSGHSGVTGEYRSGHMEVGSLYGGGDQQLQVNSMNAPNNSTMQCGCENIDCPFCNLMMSVQMSS